MKTPPLLLANCLALVLAAGLPLAAGAAPGGRQPYSIAQATSPEAQLHTAAFSGLAFITGDFGAATFLPPGKVCDYFGFQYMRDIDATGKGHNPMFLDRVAGNALRILTETQRQELAALAKEQAEPLRQLALMRLPVIQAFQRELDGDRPAGSSGLSPEAVRDYIGGVFAFDARLSYRRAEVFGHIATALSASQKAEFGKMKFGDFTTWPNTDPRAFMRRGMPHLENVAYMTYASEFFSWYAGSTDADVYFCPERHGTYFGGFYMKDMPAMGKRDFDISMTVTGDSGQAFLAVLTPGQRQHLTGLMADQQTVLAEIVAIRRQISTNLREFLAGETPDKEAVEALGRRYGELDGQMSEQYASAFAAINRTLTTEQRRRLVALRNLDGYTSAKAYLYSQPLAGPVELPDTDRFFLPAPGGKQ